MPLPSGTKLGPYEILSAVGAGGMGEVYRARDSRLDRTVAIKVLASHLSGDNALRQRFEREAKTISKFSHPSICTLHDIGNDSGLEYLVMEYIEGETLEHRLTNNEKYCYRFGSHFCPDGHSPYRYSGIDWRR